MSKKLRNAIVCLLASFPHILAIILVVNPSFAVAATPGPARTVFVQLFQWRWLDVAKECQFYLGPKGFKAVQISPPQEHVVLPRGVDPLVDEPFPWWVSYQPVSYKIESRMGTRNDFKEMVSRCSAAGVDVYADVVINHMARDSGTGWDGSNYSNNGGHAYNFTNIYQQQDFHWNVSGSHNCQSGSINDYNNQHSVQDCELERLPDLATETDYVRSRLAEYLIDLYNLGVRGYRIDAAKHMDPADIGAILEKLRARVGNNFYVVQEIIDPTGSEAVKKEWYYPFGDVNDFAYGRKLSEQFKNKNGQKLANLRTFGSTWGLAAPDKAVVFTDNHDVQRGNAYDYLTYKDNDLYRLGNIFMLAWPFGYPQLMSSYSFTNNHQSPPLDPSGQNGKTMTIYSGPVAKTPNCGSNWVCEHRWRELGNMVSFRNATFSTPQVNNWWDNGNNRIAFGRGDKGYVVINREDQPLTRVFQTRLVPGTYCDIISGDVITSLRPAAQDRLPHLNNPPTDRVSIPLDRSPLRELQHHLEHLKVVTTCSQSQQIKVDEKRQASITIPPNHAVAIHQGAMLAAAPMVDVTFNVKNAQTHMGQNVYVLGEDAGLGGWRPQDGVLMAPVDYPNWQVNIKLAPSKQYRFKFVKVDGSGNVTWEQSDRVFNAPATGSRYINETWNTP